MDVRTAYRSTVQPLVEGPTIVFPRGGCIYSSPLEEQIEARDTACYTQEEIGERENISQPQVKEILSEMANMPKSMKPLADHLVDFEVPALQRMEVQGD